MTPDPTSADNPLRALFLLDPDVIQLNHGSYGACPRPVFEEYQRWQLDLERQPTLFFSHTIKDALARARACLGHYLHTAPENLMFVTNATTGVNVVARSLRLEPGDEVLTTDHEYGALDRLWGIVCAERGARYVRQPIPLPVTSAEDVVEALWSGVTPRTRLIFMSHITSPTALILPAAQVCARARAAGIITIIDGAHGPGHVPLDLDSIGADFYTGNCHKWMCAPKGSAFLYARPEHQPMIEPLVVSWELPVEGDWLRRAEWQGTRDLSPFLAIPAAVEFLRAHEWESVRARCHAMASGLRQRLAARFGVEPISPDSADWFGQMFTLLLPPQDPADLQARIYAAHRVQLALGLWQNRLHVRACVQGYNTPRDLDIAFDALAEALPGPS